MASIGSTHEQSIEFCQQLFGKYLGGHPLMSNARHLRGSAWLNFNRVLCERWHHRNLVLIGDAAHTAHFSIGSGTKLAMEDAMSLVAQVATAADVGAGLERYRAERNLEALKLQSAARNRMEWFENVARYTHLEPQQFAYSLLTASQRIGHANLQLRDPRYVDSVERDLARRNGLTEPRPPMFLPLRLGSMELVNRVVVSPMAQYSANGRLAGRLAPDALRGACDGWRGIDRHGNDLRRSRCADHTGLHRDVERGATGRLEANRRFRAPSFTRKDRTATRPRRAQGFHTARLAGDGPPAARRQLAADLGVRRTVPRRRQSDAARDDARRTLRGFRRNSCGPRNSAPRPGSTCSSCTWRTATCSRVFSRRSPISAAMTTADRSRIACGTRSKCCGPCARRGPPASHCRCAYRRRIGRRAVSRKPISSRSRRAFKEAGVTVLSVSTGQTVADQRPVYGRMWQTPYADMIRNVVGIPTIAVGNIFEPDHVNTIVGAGRADLCAIARPHLADPAWTLHAAASQRYASQWWPDPYLAGKSQLEHNLERAALALGAV